MADFVERDKVHDVVEQIIDACLLIALRTHLLHLIDDHPTDAVDGIRVGRLKEEQGFLGVVVKSELCV